MNVRRVLVHAALLVVPAVALDLLAHAGTGTHVTRPQGLACLLLAVALGEIEASSATRPDASRAGAPGTGLALMSALGLLVTGWAAIAFPSLSTPWSWLGVPLVVAGIALRASAIRALGASFTSEIVATPGRPLVTHGVYARLRHPSDVGLLLVALGLAGLGASLAALVVATVVIVPSVVARIRAEERTLAAAAPAAHAAYRARVGLVTIWQRRAVPSPSLQAE